MNCILLLKSVRSFKQFGKTESNAMVTYFNEKQKKKRVLHNFSFEKFYDVIYLNLLKVNDHLICHMNYMEWNSLRLFSNN